MSLSYELLGEPQATHIRKQRLLDLEADHFNCVLDAEELPEGMTVPAALMDKIADIERRIRLHREALGMSTEVRESDHAAPEIPAG